MSQIVDVVNICALRRLILWMAFALPASFEFLVTTPPCSAESQWQRLFNGKDLNGWYTFVSGQGRNIDPHKLVQVHGNTIHIYRDAQDQSEQPIGYLCTEKSYSHYRLRFQYKWGKKRFVPREAAIRDAGLLFHVTGPDGRWGGVWPLSVECQVQEGDTGDLITVDTRCTSFVAPGNKENEYPTYLPRKQGGVKIQNTWYVNAGEICDRLEGWNDVEVVVRGAEKATYRVNGKVNNRLSNIEQPGTKEGTWAPLAEGRIAFQIESAEVQYRNIELLPLSPDEKRPSQNPSASPDEDNRGLEESAAHKIKSFTVPAGFEIELAAAAPLVQHPMMACLDDRGRLFVAESDGQNRESVPQILEDRPHKILMLEDIDHDGRFDKRTVFAEGLVQANGAQWYDGALYVCSAPYVWRFRDTDGDGKADEQTRIAGKFNFDGMSSAFHGPVLGPDGRFYWSGGQHGWVLEQVADQFSKQEAAGARGRDSELGGPWTRTAPGAFSSWPDGSQPENVGHGAIANPVETAFTEDGDVLGTVALLDELAGQRHDAVVLWIDGCMYHIKPHNRAGLIHTGPDLVPVSYRAGVAPAGIIRYRGSGFGVGYQDTYFFAEFNTHKVINLRIEPNGGTYLSRDEPFLVSSDSDTHFTDVIEDPDGSVLVIDTGGWFLYGCPTSQIAKPKIFGAIYRVSKKGVPRPLDPYGTAIDWQSSDPQQLTGKLVDPRFAVRDRAVLEFSKRGAAAIPALERALASSDPQLRLQSVWVLNRIADPQAQALIRKAIADADLSVRLAAVHCAGLRRDAQAAPMLIEALAGENRTLRRKAATALGRLKDPSATGPLLKCLVAGTDRFLDHAVIYTLVQIGDDNALLTELQSESPPVQRAALIALDQLESPLLVREVVIPLLDAPDTSLRNTALEVVQRHPQWADDILNHIKTWLTFAELSTEQQSAISGTVRAFWQNRAVEQLVAHTLGNEDTDIDTKVLLLETIGSLDSQEIPESWANAIKENLKDANAFLVKQATATIAERNLTGFETVLTDIALNNALPDSVRYAAATAVLRQQPSAPAGVFPLLLQCVHESQDSVERLAAALVVAHAELTSAQLEQLAAAISGADSLTLPTLLIPFEGRRDEALGLALVESLLKCRGVDGLSKTRLDKLFETYPESVRVRAQAVLDRYGAVTEDRSARLNGLLEQLADGDAQRGKDVFFDPKAACFQCHRIGDVGEEIGPNLSQIGEIRAKRDLIEAVVYPSASFAREYEPYLIVTLDGKSYAGIMSRQTAQAIYLRLNDRSEVRIDREEIDEMLPGTASIMPEGLDKTISVDEFRDLLAFLQSLK